MRLIYAIFLSLFCLNAYAHSDASTEAHYQVGRYSSVSTEPTKGQKDLLAVIIERQFDSSISTVGEAIQHILKNSGYRLADLNVSDPKLPILLNVPLPKAHRTLGPTSLRTALNTLAGPSWELIVDPVHRLISFELKRLYKESVKYMESNEG